MKRLSSKKQKRDVKNIKERQVALILLVIIVGLAFYYLLLSPNVALKKGKAFFTIESYKTRQQLFNQLKSQGYLRDPVSFRFFMFLFGKQHFEKGLYVLEQSWGNWRIMHALEARPVSTLVTFTLPPFRRRSELIRAIQEQTDLPEGLLHTALQDSLGLQRLGSGFNTESVYCIFLPGRFSLPAPATTQSVLECLYAHYDLFWTNEREKEARRHNHTAEEATILASIVYAETKTKQEMPVVAGLYQNRLDQNMKLEADPTLLFSANKVGSRRVYTKYKDNTSRYNTYRYKGLPPGPIGPVTPEAVEAVLHPAAHQYLFFCARGDKSGCHVFSKNFKDHVQQAIRYRKMLDRNKIK